MERGWKLRSMYATLNWATGSIENVFYFTLPMAGNNTSPFNVFNFVWLLIIPLSYNFWTTDPALYHKFLLIDISLLAVVAILFTGKKQLPALSMQACIFGGLYFISTMLALVAMGTHAINNADGWFVWLHLLVFPAFVLLLTLTGNVAGNQRQKISEIISWLAIISVAIAAIQLGLEVASTGWLLTASNAIKGTYTHKNIFAEVMLLTLPFTFYAFITTRMKWYLFVLLASLIMIAATLSRAVVSGIIIGAFISAVVYVAANYKQNFERRYGLMALAAIVVIAGFIYGLVNYTDVGRHILSFYNYRNTVHERQSIWQATIQLIKTYPVFGTGLGGWKILNLQYSVLGLRNYVTFFQQPHNDFLWIISEQGIVSFIFLAAAWVYLFVLLLRHIFSKPADVFNYCLLFALVGYFVYSNFGFPRERAEHGILLAFIAAFILTQEKPTLTITYPRATAFVLAALLIVAGWWAGNKLICNVYLRNALECRELNDWKQELTSLQKINSTYCTLDGTATPIAWYKGMIYFTQHNNIAALAEFKEAVKCNPYHAYSLANMGTCLSIAGNNDGAEQYFRQALTYSAGFPDAALNMCAIKFNKGQIDSAAWYLAMANDTLTDARYVKFLNVLTTRLLKPVIDSAVRYSEPAMFETYNSLLTHPNWQMELFQKAYKCNRPVSTQIWMDILWVIKYQEKKPNIADKYQKSLSLNPI